EYQALQNVTADERGKHKGDSQHDIARACHMGAIFCRHGLREERIEANPKRREWNRHEEGYPDDGRDLPSVVEQPREKDKCQVSDAIENGSPEHGAAEPLSFEPAAGRDRENEIHDSRHGSNQPDLKTGSAKPRGVDVEEVDRGAAEDSKPRNVEIQVQEIG